MKKMVFIFRRLEVQQVKDGEHPTSTQGRKIFEDYGNKARCFEAYKAMTILDSIGLDQVTLFFSNVQVG